ncbi:alpha beta hydrolase fold family [Verticillium dahliae]
MVGTSIWHYILIRTSIFLLSLIAPLSTLYSLVRAVFLLPLHFPRVLEIWLALEAVFYLAFYLPRQAHLQKAAVHPPTACRKDRRRLFRQCNNNIPEPEQYLTKWFQDATLTEIKRENLKDFFRWAFLNTGEVDPAYDGELEEYVGQMEKLLGRKVEPGRGNVKCLRLTLDKVEMLHRSLTWYLCVFVVDTVAWFYLRHYSFQFHRTSFLAVFPLRPFSLLATNRSPAKTLTYWHRPHTSKTRLPVLFIHGIGIGLYQYIDFLADLNAENSQSSPDGQVGIIALEILSVSSRITGEAMAKDEMCAEIACILNAHGWQRLVLVSHSYGSVVATHLIHAPQTARKVGSILFVDPVAFLLHLPHVAYNFTYRKPTHANEHLLSYFGAKDMGTSHTLFRRFFWAENILWKEDIQDHRVCVVLSGRDRIIDAKVVGAYLTGADDWSLELDIWEDGVWEGDMLEVLWFAKLDHGQAFGGDKARKKLVDVVRRFCVEV